MARGNQDPGQQMYKDAPASEVDWDKASPPRSGGSASPKRDIISLRAPPSETPPTDERPVEIPETDRPAEPEEKTERRAKHARELTRATSHAVELEMADAVTGEERPVEDRVLERHRDSVPFQE